MKNIPLILILFVLFSCKEKKQTNIINTLHQKALTQNDSTLIYLNQAKKRITTNIADSIKAENYFLFGNYYEAIHQTKPAYESYNKAINYIKDNINSNRKKTYFKRLIYSYKKNGDYLNSLGVLDKFEHGINPKDYNNLGEINTQKQSIYKLLKNYKASLHYNKQSIHYFALAKDTSRLVNSLILQANLNYYNFKNKKEAYRLLDSLLTINITSVTYKKILKNQLYQSYGIFKYYDKNYKASYQNYKKSLHFLRTPKTHADSLGLANSYANIAEVCMDLTKYNEAKKYNDSVELFKDLLNANLRDFHLQNKLRLAYETQSDFAKVSNSLKNVTKTMNANYQKRITDELTALKTANKKEKELLITNQKVVLKNAELKRKQILLFSFLGVFLLTLLFYSRQKKLKREKDEIFMQQRLFRAQMNPHFTSNVLYTIQDLILENKEKANKYLIKFSRLLRLNLENSMHNYTLIEKEIEILTKYLDLQQLRFPNKFDYEINTNDLDIDLLAIPPMLIQPFVENAIEHGFKNINYKGHITIDLSEKNNFIFCKITDNGLGIQEKQTNKNHTSASTLLIKSLLKNMTKKAVVIQNNKDKGVIVSFNMPFKEV